MVMKGAVQPDHTPKNNFELIILGLPPILITEFSGLEQETESAEMPDRTVVSGGNVKATEHDIKTFEHHAVETAALELWRREGIDPVSPTYKKTGTLIKRSISGAIASTRTVTGVWIKKRTDDDLELANEGEPVMITWLLSIDKIESI
jgi:hypothetical protein